MDRFTRPCRPGVAFSGQHNFPFIMPVSDHLANHLSKLDFCRARGEFGAASVMRCQEEFVADHNVHDLTPEEVSKGIEAGRYLLVDVREPNEVAVEAYPSGVVVPLSTFDPKAIPDPQGKQAGFAGRSGQPPDTAPLRGRPPSLPGR